MSKVWDYFSAFSVRFWVPCALVLAMFVAGCAYPIAFNKGVDVVNDLIFNFFGNFYLWFTALTLLAFCLIGISPLGNIRLGGQDAKPDHHIGSWFAMLFCAGMGTGLMFWGSAEPLYHYMNPPMQGVMDPTQREMLALHYAFFHWGMHPWAIYGMAGLAIGFFGFNLKRGFEFSAFLKPVSGGPNTAQRYARLTIDLFTIIAIVFGIAATFGMGVLQLQGGMQSIFHIPASPWLTISIIVVMTAIYLGSALKGIQNGIKILSNLNFWLYLVLLAAVAWLGPHVNGYAPVLQSLPGFIAKLPAMSFGVGHYVQPHWVRDWTVKYWSWWIAWTPFVGVFIALISKGRTVRQMVWATVLLPTVFSCLWFTLFGQAAIQLQNQTHFVGNHLDLNNVNTILFDMTRIIGHNQWLPCLCLFMIALDFINSADSATFTISTLSTRHDPEHPPIRLRFAWGVVFALLTGLFLLTGGINLLQQVTLVTALPFSILMVGVFGWLVFALIRYARETASIKLAVKPIATIKRPQQVKLRTAMRLFFP